MDCPVAYNTSNARIKRCGFCCSATSQNAGAVVDLDGLPPGLGGAAASIPLLESLEERQFLAWERIGTGLYLADRNVPLSKFRIEWAVINRRRAAEISKLQAVQKYAYTKECRRGFVLRYFGDPAARARCDGCDNCLGIAAVASDLEDSPRRRRDKKPRTGSSKRRRGQPALLARITGRKG